MSTEAEGCSLGPQKVGVTGRMGPGASGGTARRVWTAGLHSEREFIRVVLPTQSLASCTIPNPLQVVGAGPEAQSREHTAMSNRLLFLCALPFLYSVTTAVPTLQGSGGLKRSHHVEHLEHSRHLPVHYLFSRYDDGFSLSL